MSIQVANLWASVGVTGAGQSIRDLQGVSGQINRTQGVMSGLARNAGQIGHGIGQVGAGLIRVGSVAAVAVAGIGVAAAKVNIDFQDAFAGVRKTVDGTKADLDTLYDALKALSTRIPVSFTDLAGIAQEAGALGVATPNVAAFSEAVARVTAATVGLDIGQASEAFGKLGTIFSFNDLKAGESRKAYSRLGSALIELGNNAASTEGDIIAVAQRFASVGQKAGLSAAQVLGWSSAIASLGPLAEAAGSSLTRIFGNVIKYAGTGDKRLDTFAKTAGLSTKAFKALLGSDVDAAMQRFLGGLSKLDKFQLGAVLKGAGITQVRDINAIQALAAHTGFLAKSVDDSTRAYTENTAIVAVSEKRFDTFKSHLKELGNTALAAADTFGQGLNPALDRLAKKAATFVGDHSADFRRLGADLGSAIDRIDWDKVAKGADNVVSVMRDMLAVVKKIPIEIDLAVAGFLGVNKVSGGLLGKGLGNIAGGLAGAVATVAGGVLRTVLGKIPKVGGALSQIGAAPVFVTNWPIGFGGPGGLPGVGGGGSSALALLGATGIAAAIVLAAVPIGEAFAKALPDWLKGGPGPDTGKTQSQLAFDFYQAQKDAAKGGDSPALHGAVPTWAPGADRGLDSPALHNMTDAAAMAGKGLTGVAAAARRAQLSLQSPKLRGDLSDLIRGITRRSAEAHGGKALGAGAIDRTYQKDLIHEARMIHLRTGSLADKVEALKRLVRLSDQHGDHGTAIKINRQIAALRTKVGETTTAARTAGTTVSRAIDRKDLTVTPQPITLNLDGRRIASAMARYSVGGRVI